MPNSIQGLSILSSLNDMGSSGRFTCDEYKIIRLEENNNLKSICKCNCNRLALPHLNIIPVGNKIDKLTQ